MAGESVKANGGIVGLSATGAIKLYTLTGPTDAILDITGYFTSAGGVDERRHRQRHDGDRRDHLGRSRQRHRQSDRVGVTLPGVAPVALTDATVNFASGASDNDATCTGTVAAPTAPPGKVCIYCASVNVRCPGLEHLRSWSSNLPDAERSSVTFTAQTTGADVDVFLYATWAYTAP